jgi:hypothetical protein
MSRRPAKEQPPADMRDDKTANTTADYTHIPSSSLEPSIPCPPSDRCATAVPVVALRRSTPDISRFCPFLGWRTILRLLTRRGTESNVFSVPERNPLWRRTEDGLLVQAVAKYEVGRELSGRSEQQCKERHSLADTVVQLTFVFLRVIFRGSPGSFKSSHVLTKDGDSADSARPLHYSKSDSRLARAPVLSPSYSLTHAHRFIGYRNRNPQPLTDSSARLIYLRVYDNRDSSRQPAPSPSLCCSLTHAHRSIGYRNRNLITQLPHRPPSRSHMYTGASVLATQSGRFFLPL